MSLIYQWRLRFVPSSELSVSWPCGTRITRQWTCFGWPNMSLQRPNKVLSVLATYWERGCGIHSVSFVNKYVAHVIMLWNCHNERGGITDLSVSALTKIRTGDVRIWNRFLSLAETCLYSATFKPILGPKRISIQKVRGIIFQGYTCPLSTVLRLRGDRCRVIPNTLLWLAWCLDRHRKTLHCFTLSKCIGLLWMAYYKL